MGIEKLKIKYKTQK